MTPDQAKRIVAERCFGFAPTTAAMAEDVAAELLAASAAADWAVYKEAVDGAGKCPFGRQTDPVIRPYDAAVMDVLDGEMRVSAIRAAVETKHPDVILPRNLSMAMIRLKDRGVATNRINAQRVAIWRKTDQ